MNTSMEPVPRHSVTAHLGSRAYLGREASIAYSFLEILADTGQDNSHDKTLGAKSFERIT